MTLPRQLVKVLLLMIVIVAALYGTTRFITVVAYSKLERRDIDQNVRRLDQAVKSRTGRLAILAHEWAVWDDAYRYIRGEYPEFDSQLAPEVLGELDINLLAFVSPEGTIFDGRAVDPVTGEMQAFPPSVRHAIEADPPLIGSSQDPASRSGALLIDGKPFLFASQPITTSDGAAAPYGYLLVGRFIDGTELQALTHATQLPVAAYTSTRDDRLPEAAKAAFAKSALSNPVPVTAGDVATGYRVMEDPQGNPSFVLGIRMPRTIRTAREQSLGYLLAALVCFGLVACTLVAGALTRQHRALIERQRAEAARDVSKERYRGLIDTMPDAVIGIGTTGRVVLANHHAFELTGREENDLLGRSFIELLSHESGETAGRRQRLVLEFGSVEEFEADLIHESGTAIPVEVSMSPLINDVGAVVGIQWIARDITERKRYETQLVHLANRDHLTGLYNRRRFEEELRRQLDQIKRNGRQGAVLWFDIDHFKEINDSLGHRAGDAVLVGLATRLETHLRAESLFARLGGDEFAVLIPEASPESAEATATRVLNEIRDASFLVEGRPVRVTASIGMVLFPDHGNEAEELLARADLAMYRAKEDGRNRLCAYRPDEDWQADLQSRFDWTVLIERALQEDRFLVYAQPIVGLEDGSVHRHELLIRMEADDGSILLPGTFLPVAERTGLINDIDRWMVRQAIDLISMRASRGDPFRLDVNLSTRALSDPELLPIIEFELMRTGIEPAMLGIEITETAAVSDMSKAVTFLRALHSLGCRIALDDFGSGFSSFYYLRHLPVDSLKIDGSFVRNLLSNPQDQHVIRAIVELATGFGVSSTAEFVEDAETFEMLRQLGVTYAQGYHIARPQPLVGGVWPLPHEVLATATSDD